VSSHDTDFTPKSLHVSHLQRNVMCTVPGDVCHNDTNLYRGYRLPLTCIYGYRTDCACIVCALALHFLHIRFIFCWKLAISNVDGWRKQQYGL